MITDNCPNCDKPHNWDACQDIYEDTLPFELESYTDDEDRRVTVYYCTCGTAMAMFLTDDNGGTIFVPSTKEL